mgnify:CR=1 FL=1
MAGYIGAKVGTVTGNAADIKGDISSTDTSPDLTLKNTTQEDTDGGRESTITFKGEQTGGEESTLAEIRASHDGTSDDQKGDLIFKTNDGSDNAAPTERLKIDSSGAVGLGCSPDASVSLDVQNLSASSNNVLIRTKNTTSGEDSGVVIEGNNGGQKEYRIGINTVANTPDLTFSGSTGYRFLVGSSEKVTINSDGKTSITGAGVGNSPTLNVSNTTGNNSFNHSIEALSSTLGAGNTNVILVGKEGNNYNSAWVGYKWQSNASIADNKITIGHWNANHLWTINGNGHIQIVNQPCFLARATTTHSLGSNWQIVEYGSLVSQKGGSNFNATNYRFTAPVDGFYQFNAQWTATHNADVDGTLAICVNGSTTNLFGSSSMTNTSTGSGTYDAHVVSGAGPLSAGDYVDVRRYSSVANTTRGTYPYGGWFSGFLIG